MATTTTYRLDGLSHLGTTFLILTLRYVVLYPAERAPLIFLGRTHSVFLPGAVPLKIVSDPQKYWFEPKARLQNRLRTDDLCNIPSCFPFPSRPFSCQSVRYEPYEVYEELFYSRRVFISFSPLTTPKSSGSRGGCMYPWILICGGRVRPARHAFVLLIMLILPRRWLLRDNVWPLPKC
ncbi:hypothetical protein DFS33DRAFT_215526 [Desarmillaria ectypa]|nr:hypothetical protein DFS33DRAFT_215526 [Desarmillaria ectypa]